METKGPFPWQALQVVCGETSVLDIDRLELKTDAEAYQFILSYGFDLYESSHIEQLQKIHSRAIHFIESYICFEGLQYPEALKSLDLKADLKGLLLIASGLTPSGHETLAAHRRWICATLRVMHAVLHLQSDLRLKYLPKIKRQTVDRIEAHIQRSEKGDVFLGFEADKVQLVDFQKKETKVRDSVIMKLLHKASATAQEVYDHVGVRFITQSRVDVFRVIKYLIDHHLVAYPHVMSFRVRNSLMDLKDFRKWVESAGSDPKATEEKIPFPNEGEKENRFTAESFHSLQFTARQLIRIPVVRKGGQKREMAFFFPLEIQIMDKKSFKEAMAGRASHELYKQKQLDAVRKRVLRGLLHETT